MHWNIIAGAVKKKQWFQIISATRTAAIATTFGKSLPIILYILANLYEYIPNAQIISTPLIQHIYIYEV